MLKGRMQEGCRIVIVKLSYCMYSRNGRLRRPTLVNGHVMGVISKGHLLRFGLKIKLCMMTESEKLCRGDMRNVRKKKYEKVFCSDFAAK